MRLSNKTNTNEQTLYFENGYFASVHSLSHSLSPVVCRHLLGSFPFSLALNNESIGKYSIYRLLSERINYNWKLFVLFTPFSLILANSAEQIQTIRGEKVKKLRVRCNGSQLKNIERHLNFHQIHVNAFIEQTESLILFLMSILEMDSSFGVVTEPGKVQCESEKRKLEKKYLNKFLPVA